MIFQVWLTVLLIAALILGGVWALIRRPFLQRWQLETRREEEARLQAEEEHAQRVKALQEIESDCAVDLPQQEGLPQRVQESKKQ